MTSQSKKDWEPGYIKWRLERTGATLTGLALQYGLSEGACRKSLRVASPAADQAISQQLKVPLHRIWPSRYDKQGRRVKEIHVREKVTCKRDDSQRLSAEAV